MKFSKDDFSLGIDFKTNRLYALALMWVIGRFDEDTMSWVEYEKRELLKYDNDIVVPTFDELIMITGGYFVGPEYFKKWIEQD